MYKKIVVVVAFLVMSFCGTAQNELNNYKYVIVPLQYEFLKGRDTYRLNTLTRVLFKEAGFKAYFNEEKLPEDLFIDRCLALYTDVLKLGGGPFRKKVQIIIKNCKGDIVYESSVGDSKENNHQKAYNEALRNAFKSITKLNYKYQSNSDKEILVESTQKDKVDKKDKVNKIQEIEKIEDVKVVNNKKPAVSVMESKTREISENNIGDTLYLNPITNGYELIDEKKNVMMILLNTAAKNVFIVKGKDAIVFKENGIWMYSENNGISSSVKELNLKF